MSETITPNTETACSQVYTHTQAQLTASLAKETWENYFKIKKERRGESDTSRRIVHPPYPPRIVPSVLP